MVEDRKTTGAIIGLVGFFTLWLVLLFQIRIGADVAWLTQAAEHFLRGQSMVEYFFETNPPLSVLIYLPVALLKQLGLSSWTALNIFVLTLTVFSFFSSRYFLRFWDIPPIIKSLFLLGFFFVVTCLSSFDYGQRDHMLAIMLLPFVLGQLSITFGHKPNSPFRLLTFILVSPFILIKPHYGLIPTAVLIHRLIKTRSLKLVLDSDFIVLALATLSYIAVVLLVFPDFVSVILPATFDLYASEFSGSSTLVYFICALSFAVLGIALASYISNDQTLKSFLTIFSILAALLLIPYLVQHKGFRYHLLPYLSVLIPVMICSIYAILPFEKNPRLKRIFYFDVAMLLIAGSVFVIRGSLTFNHTYVDNNVIAQKIAETPEGSSFYIEYNTTGLVIQISEYMNREYASRFPAPWLFPNDPEDEETWDKYLEMNKRYIFADFERYKPELIFLLKHEKYLNILTAYEDTPEFKAFFADYEYMGEIEDPQFSELKSTFGETPQIMFSMYARKDEP